MAYEHEPNANRRELRSRSGGLLAWHDRITDQTFDQNTTNGRGLAIKQASEGQKRRMCRFDDPVCHDLLEALIPLAIALEQRRGHM